MQRSDENGTLTSVDLGIPSVQKAQITHRVATAAFLASIPSKI
jgi:hypothetical protein